MDPTDVLRQIIKAPAHAASPSALKVVVVYQDTRTWAWAAELWSRVTQGLGADAASIDAWGLDELSRPQVFPRAVLMAADADAVIVSIHATEQIPPGLCSWIDTWLPRRHAPGGALIALIGVSGPRASSDRAQTYLRAVAHKGRLEFLLHEYFGPFGSGKIPAKTAANPLQINPS